MHTPLCKHAVGTPDHYAQAAQAAGLKGIVMTDHCPMPPWFDPEVRMDESQLPLYIGMMQQTRQRFANFYVGIGLEMDYHPGTEGYVQRIKEAFNWDYLIGSVHFIGAWPMDNPHFAAEFGARNLRQVYADYFSLIVQAAQSGLYHSIGHLDLPKVMGHRPPEGYLDLAEPALQAIAQAGMAIDINTAGWRKPAAEVYPHPALMSKAKALGIPVVLGSDAHRPQDVGHRFSEAVELLKQAGYSEAVVFVQGQMQPYPLG